MTCPNCGMDGPHFVPPSLGEPGFFICDNSDPRDALFVRLHRGRATFSRTASCGCGWSPKLHGDFCPEHGLHATMRADKLNPKRMFLDYSPLPEQIKYTDLHDIRVRSLPSVTGLGSLDRIESSAYYMEENIHLHQYEYPKPGVKVPGNFERDMRTRDDFWYEWYGWHEPSKTLYIHRMGARCRASRQFSK